jgi:putative intracellular protease/amidase/YHS domain-containing protein
MNRIASRAVVIFSLSVLVPLTSPVHADDAPTKPRVALHGLDPIALVEGKEVQGTEGFATTRGRYRYLFTDAEHKAQFERDPDRYAIPEAGCCSVMPTAPISPGLFAVHESRIYYFASPHCQAAFKESPAEYLKPRKNVAILVYEGVELLDFAGPGEVFSTAGGGRAYNVYLVAATTEPITSQGFASVNPRYKIADCPKPDILIIPGGFTQIPAEDPAVIEWIKASAKDAEVVLSVCTGAFLLGKAGLLDGLDVTTHHDRLAMLKKLTPKANVVEGRRFVDNGRIVTSAGVSAGIDASLHVVGRLLGPKTEDETSQRLEYGRKTESKVEPR